MQLGLFAALGGVTPDWHAWWLRSADETLEAWQERTYAEHVREYEGPRCDGCGLPVVVCTRHQRRFRAGEKVHPEEELFTPQCQRRT